METIKIDKQTHKGKSWLSLDFPYNNTIKSIVKQLNNATWSVTCRAWLVDDSPENRKNIKIIFKDKAKFEIGKRLKQNPDSEKETNLSYESINSIEKYTQWLRSRRYSHSTVKTYTEALKVFLKYFVNKPLTEICNNDVIDFNNEIIIKNNLSASYQNQIVDAIKLFFLKI